MGRGIGGAGGDQRFLNRGREETTSGSPRRPIWLAVLFTSLVWVVLGGAALVMWRRPVPVAFEIQPPPATATPQPTATPEPLLVEVTGAVRAAGVYALPRNSRVQDAIAAAGGLAADADASTVRQARELVDGERVLVPARADPKLTPAGQGGPGSAGEARAVAGFPRFPIPINTASMAELEELPGIGPKTAQAIVDYRSAHGPFVSIEDILQVKGIGEVTLGRIRGLITLD